MPVKGEIGEHDTLLSIDKARRLLGYAPRALVARPRGLIRDAAQHDAEDPRMRAAARVLGSERLVEGCRQSRGEDASGAARAPDDRG